MLPLDVVSDGQSTATDVGDASHDEAMSDDRETCKFSICLIERGLNETLRHLFSR